MDAESANSRLVLALDAAEDATPVQAVQAVTHQLARAVRARSVSLLIADLSGRALVRLAQAYGEDATDPDVRQNGDELATVLPFDGGPAEQTLRTQQIHVLPPDATSSWVVLAPVTQRGEALGLLEFLLPQEPSESVVDEIRSTAHLLSYVLIATRRHTDLFEWGQRSTRFNLSAEIQRRLLPAAYTCEAGSFTLAAWLEPAATIGGDTFDYSIDRDYLHLSVTDAVGHGLDSALTATLCVGSLRNTRRQGATLLEQAEAANEAMFTHARGTRDEMFATAILGRLELASGDLHLVNAGHVVPLLARSGQVNALDLAVDLPLGMFSGTAYRSSTVRLVPGDRMIIVTDGMLERAAASLDLTAQVLRTRDLHPREAVRALTDLVLEACGGELPDDAALLIIDWYGAEDADRETVAGADIAS